MEKKKIRTEDKHGRTVVAGRFRGVRIAEPVVKPDKETVGAIRKAVREVVVQNRKK